VSEAIERERINIGRRVKVQLLNPSHFVFPA
jgi:hypothetical protein